MARPIHQVSVVEAKAHFSKWVREAERGGVVIVQRHGKDVAAVVPAAVADRLRRLRAGPEGGLAGLAGGWRGSDALANELESIRRSRSGVRLR
jgi:prevent-host-death family protein